MKKMVSTPGWNNPYGIIYLGSNYIGRITDTR